MVEDRDYSAVCVNHEWMVESVPDRRGQRYEMIAVILMRV
jgi:hypothetical protein